MSWCQIVRCQIVLVPNCLSAQLSVFLFLGAKLSGAKLFGAILSYNPLFTPMKLSHLIICLLLLAVNENFAAFTALIYMQSPALIAETSCQPLFPAKASCRQLRQPFQAVYTFNSFCKLLAALTAEAMLTSNSLLRQQFFICIQISKG